MRRARVGRRGVALAASETVTRSSFAELNSCDAELGLVGIGLDVIRAR